MIRFISCCICTRRWNSPFFSTSSSCVPTSDDLAVLEHDQAVGVAQRAQAVRDGEGRAALDQAGDRVLDLLLGLGVDRGGRLVEDQDARVVQDRAGDADALALAAAERLAALARPACRSRPASGG